ncbi:T9SS type A sorting domain-containing protein [Bacteroidota bacterium]
MLKKIFLLALLVILSGSLVYSQNKPTQEQINRVSKLMSKSIMNGDAVVGVRTDGKTDLNGISNLPPVAALFTSPFNMTYESDFITSATFTPTGGTSIYDIQSNSVPVELWQSPIDPNQVHAVYMIAPLGDPGFANRRCNYYFSTDRGTTWSFIGEIPNAVRSGYPTVTGLSDNNIMVANHYTDGISRTFIFVDVFPGLGSWLQLDPVLGPHIQAEWPRFIATGNITNPTKMVILSSGNASDTCWSNTGQTLTPPGTFTGWTFFPDADNAERHAIARGQDGRIGVTYFPSPTRNASDWGDLFFVESTDDGATFSAPLKIFDANLFVDSLGAASGIALVYQGNEPKVIFSTPTLSPGTPGSSYPGADSKIRFWSPTLPGSDPNKSVVVADSNNVPWNPYIWITASDGLSGICKPNIGISADGNVLFSAFLVASAFTGGSADTLSYMDGYFTASGDGGLTWKTPVKITPDSPRRDWTNTSISPINDDDANNWYANLLIQSDSVPGSFVNHTTNGESLAQLMFVRVEVSRDSVIGIKNISSEIPGEYSLQQNYPNPFNPSTTIRFNIPNTSNVTLKIYNISGQEVATLVNNEVVSAGIKEIDFNAVNLSSGIYFYTIKANDFTATKKMVLLK